MSADRSTSCAVAAIHDPVFCEALKREPEAVTPPLPLTAEDRRALLAGEVGRLHELGVNGFLLSHLP